MRLPVGKISNSVTAIVIRTMYFFRTKTTNQWKRCIPETDSDYISNII